MWGPFDGDAWSTEQTWEQLEDRVTFTAAGEDRVEDACRMRRTNIDRFSITTTSVDADGREIADEIIWTRITQAEVLEELQPPCAPEANSRIITARRVPG